MGVAIGNMIEPFVNREFHMDNFWCKIKQVEKRDFCFEISGVSHPLRGPTG